MARKRYLIPLVAVAAAAVFRWLRPRSQEQLRGNALFFSRTGAALYDLFAGWVLSPLYDRVARDVVSLGPAGTVLDVGSGPGHLSVRLARMNPRLTVVGLDLSPEMVEKARGRASRAGVADRVAFEVGDVAAMSFPDAQFDLVVSTLSMHHWPDVERGLAEIKRVLKPGGQACIYDLREGALRAMHHADERSPIEAAWALGDDLVVSPFDIGPIRALSRLCLTRAAATAPTSGGS